MEKYKLVGIENPEKGIRKIVGQMGVVRINNAMPDEIAEYCIKNGMDKYFEKVVQPEEEQPEKEELEERKPAVEQPEEEQPKAEQLEELNPKEPTALPVNVPLPEVNAVQIVPEKKAKKTAKK